MSSKSFPGLRRLVIWRRHVLKVPGEGTTDRTDQSDKPNGTAPSERRKNLIRFILSIRGSKNFIPRFNQGRQMARSVPPQCFLCVSVLRKSTTMARGIQSLAGAENDLEGTSEAAVSDSRNQRRFVEDRQWNGKQAIWRRATEAMSPAV